MNQQGRFHLSGIDYQSIHLFSRCTKSTSSYHPSRMMSVQFAWLLAIRENVDQTLIIKELNNYSEKFKKFYVWQTFWLFYLIVVFNFCEKVILHMHSIMNSLSNYSQNLVLLTEYLNLTCSYFKKEDLQLTKGWSKWFCVVAQNQDKN